MANTFAGLKNK